MAVRTLVVAVGFLSISACAPERTFSVCEIAGDLPSYSGKRISVRGVYRRGLREACGSGAEAHSVTLDIRDAANIEPDVIVDYDSWDRLDELVLKQAAAETPAEIWVTVTGVLRSTNGKDGYGHLGVLPGEIVAERFTDLTVDPEGTLDYRDQLKIAR